MANYTNGVIFEEVEDIHSTVIYGRFLDSGYPPIPLTGLQNQFPDETYIGLDEFLDTGCVFYYPGEVNPTDTVTISAQHFPMQSSASPNQKIMKSGSGQLAIYSEDHHDKLLHITLKNLSITKIDRLYKFLVNIVDGALNTFQFLDESGTLYTVRWMDKAFDRYMPFWLLHEIKITMRKEE